MPDEVTAVIESNFSTPYTISLANETKASVKGNCSPCVCPQRVRSAPESEISLSSEG